MKGHRRTPGGAGPRGRVPARSRLPSRLVPQQHRSFSAGASCAARSEHPGSSRNSAGASTSQAHLAPVVPTRELLGGGCAARRSLPPPSPAARTLRSRRSAGPLLKPPGWGEGNSVSEKMGVVPAGYTGARQTGGQRPRGHRWTHHAEREDSYPGRPQAARQGC